MRPALSCLLTFLLTVGMATAAVAATDDPPRFSASSTGESTDYTQVVDLTYPTAQGTTYGDDYDAGRGAGRVHRATDLFGQMGEKVYAAQGGTILWMPGRDPAAKNASAGYGMQIRGTDGRIYAYYHLGPDEGEASSALAAGLDKGDTVARGQHIGYLGDSGNAAGGSPHLHFEIHDDGVTDPYGTNRVNPYFSLEDAEERGDYPVAGLAGDGVPQPDGGAGPNDGAVGDGDASPPADDPAPVDRVAGPDRVRTAVALSQAAFDEADHIVLAAAGSFADSVAAGPLAALHDGPVLTTRAATLEPAVIDEIARLGASRVTVVGGEMVVGMQIERDLVEEAGLAPSRIDRLSGRNRYETAVAIAEVVWEQATTRRAGVALGQHEQEHRAWPDALAAGYHGAVTGAPVLLVTPDGVPAATAAALHGVAEVTVVGGVGVVPDAVYAAVDGHAGTVRRLAGPDRYMTAAAVAADLLDGDVSAARVWAATGHSFADAVAAAPAVAAQGEVLLLIDGTDGGKDSRLAAWLGERADAITAGRVIGGTAAISDDAKERLAERIQ